MFKSISISKENFPSLEVSLSTLRTHNADGEPYVDSEGNPFSFYWITLNGNICATGRKFTALLGDNATDASAAQVIKAHQDEFMMAQATDADGSPIYIDDDPSRPLLKVVARAHSVMVEW